MGKKITIDPITRIEGHLRIDVEVENGKVVDAWSSAQMFRGLELILKGRDPRDAPLITQRACGVCTYVHMLASVMAVDDAVKVKIPDNARIMRNLMIGAHCIHDHLVHFYHLHALDWVDVVSALSADPKKTADLSNAVSDAPGQGAKDFKAVQDKLKAFVKSGQLGPFANAYWGHPAYKLPPEANLMAVKHYLDALRHQVKVAQMSAIFGAKNPHLQSSVPGGVTCGMDLDVDHISQYLFMLKETQSFIDNVYLPDILAVGSFYKDWGAIGGCTNYMAYGAFPNAEGKKNPRFLPNGTIMKKNLGDVRQLDAGRITEDVTRAWYKPGKARHPYDGVTEPMKPKWDYGGKYSFFKAPRYQGEPMEVGPLSHMLVAYGAGHPQVKALVDKALGVLKVPATALFSTLGRTAARCIETKVYADHLVDEVTDLIANVKAGKTATWKSFDMTKGMGSGMVDVPRGALGHWVKIKDSKIDNYQMVVPSTWNLGPRCAKGKLGPVEEALIGTPIADPEKPLEVLRTVHSFDPCIACGVHVIDRNSGDEYEVKVL
ncbi:MAG: nickel-dependent hydrogenase large subunit [Desulfarculaceae bacterium]|jgi:[NiFe] hydrogenase large subunit